MESKNCIPPQNAHILLIIIYLHFFHNRICAAKVTVKGKVTAADDGMGLPGVNVMEKGTTNSASTTLDGNYQIAVSPHAILVFSYIGFAPPGSCCK